MFKKIILAAVFAVAAPVASMAATLIGQLDIVGTIENSTSDFSNTGNVDFTTGTGTAILATGDFASFITAPVAATLTDIDFTAPGTIWSVGGFTFTATNYFGIGSTPNEFHAGGTITGNGFDATLGTLQFTAQNGVSTTSFSTSTTAVPLPAGAVLLLTGLAGLGVARRRKTAA